jgi:hypothetical protein
MVDLKKFVEETLEIAEAMMSEHLLFQRNGSLPEFDLSRIDDPSNHEAGYYFVHQDREAWKKARVLMFNRLRASEQWSKLVDVEGDGITFQQAGVDEYESWDVKFRELLSILMMMTCGLSGRGTEMTSLRYMNTMEGDRSIYLEHGQIMFVTEYHKSMALMDDIKVFFCFLRSVAKFRLFHDSCHIESVYFLVSIFKISFHFGS